MEILLSGWYATYFCEEINPCCIRSYSIFFCCSIKTGFSLALIKRASFKNSFEANNFILYILCFLKWSNVPCKYQILFHGPPVTCRSSNSLSISITKKHSTQDNWHVFFPIVQFLILTLHFINKTMSFKMYKIQGKLIKNFFLASFFFTTTFQ